MRLHNKLIAIAMLGFLVTGLNAQVKSPKKLAEEYWPSVHWVTPQQAYKMMKTTPNLVVIDIRESGEYMLGHLPGAIFIPRGFLEFRIGFITKDANRPIIVYCRSGHRATFAYEQLVRMGYKKVYNLKGGFLGWKKAGLPISRKPNG